MNIFTEKFEKSKHIRDEQYTQLLNYLSGQLKSAYEKRDKYFSPDYSSIEKYTETIEKYREDFKNMIGFPPPYNKKLPEAKEEFIGEDELCKIYRVFVSVAEDLDCYGILMVPKNNKGKAPLMLSLHGGSGCPELVCSFNGSENYNDASRRYVQEGFIVFSPLFTFLPCVDKDNTIIPRDVRSILDVRAKWLDSSLAAIEIFKVIKSLDYILTKSEVNSADVGISGLSYGGFYSLLITVLDQRIKYCVSSCYFNDRVLVNEIHPNELFDWTWKGMIGKFADAEIIGMICPRPCIIEVGTDDYFIPIEGARSEYIRAKKYYDMLGISERFKYIEFQGTHEYNLSAAIRYIREIRKNQLGFDY
jgi:hypothetical protein